MARQQRARFLATRKPETPVVSLRAATAGGLCSLQHSGDLLLDPLLLPAPSTAAPASPRMPSIPQPASPRMPSIPQRPRMLHTHLFSSTPTLQPVQVLRGMDLYVGAGGLGYLDHVSQLPDGTPDPNGWVAPAALRTSGALPVSPTARRLGSLEPGLRAPTQLLSCCPGVPACLAVFASTLPPLLPCCPAACSASPSAACRVQTRTDWACDYEADMAQTFKANNQHSHVRGGGAALSWQLGGCCYHLLERRASSARCIVVCAPQHLPIHSPV